ncbi:MAG: MGMT family protein [Chitinispirillaceae bacterium]|nr:MGMT family protein [Chitinispirillaceae bacterium]
MTYTDPEGIWVIDRVALPDGSAPKHQFREISSHPIITRHARLITSFLAGKKVDLSSLPINLSGMTPFAKDVLTAARKIPYGKTVSYAHCAGMAGYPDAVRATASVLRSNRFPIVVPCHRVIRSDGSIGGFMGEHEGRAIALKKHLLELERGSCGNACKNPLDCFSQLFFVES